MTSHNWWIIDITMIFKSQNFIIKYVSQNFQNGTLTITRPKEMLDHAQSCKKRDMFMWCHLKNIVVFKGCVKWLIWMLKNSTKKLVTSNFRFKVFPSYNVNKKNHIWNFHHNPKFEMVYYIIENLLSMKICN